MKFNIKTLFTVGLIAISMMLTACGNSGGSFLEKAAGRWVPAEAINNWDGHVITEILKSGEVYNENIEGDKELVGSVNESGEVIIDAAEISDFTIILSMVDENTINVQSVKNGEIDEFKLVRLSSEAEVKLKEQFLLSPEELSDEEQFWNDDQFDGTSSYFEM